MFTLLFQWLLLITAMLSFDQMQSSENQNEITSKYLKSQSSESNLGEGADLMPHNMARIPLSGCDILGKAG